MLRDLWVGLCATTGAACLSQGPEFLQQYLQRLGGHLDEARHLLGQVPALATRIAELQLAQDSLSSSGTYARPFAFIRTLQPDIAWNTLAEYQPAMPLSLEGLAYAGAGLIIGTAFGALLAAGLRAMTGRKRMLYGYD